MGTTYRVKVTIEESGVDLDELKSKIDKRLDEINKSMSTYDYMSEISRFNRTTDTTKFFQISEDFYEVMLKSKELYDLTHGAWDGTVNPLVDLWGFGQSEKPRDIPSDKEIDSLLSVTGFDHIEISESGLKKRNPDISIDLSSIAKGYGVDQAAELLDNLGFESHLVEIGGEVYASGMKKDGTPWRVGVDQPDKDTRIREIYAVIQLSDQAVATSGDYRNYFELEGEVRQYSHIIDPKKGRPVDNGIAGVSVIADNCAFADGLATAIMVAGVERSLELVNNLENVECVIIKADEKNRFKGFYSDGFQAFMHPNSPPIRAQERLPRFAPDPESE